MTTKVCAVDELKPGGVKKVMADGTPVAVFDLNGAYFAIDDTCSHALSSLSEGFFEDGLAECPKHGSQFDVRTGQPVSLPATRPVRTHTVTVKGDDIYVEVTP